jgi:glycosyltransferase involved in cell wall biosynthesis
MHGVQVAVTLEQCWHAVPGGTAWSTLELVRALERRDDVELVGVSARHREPPPPQWTPSIEVRQLPLPRNLLYETWHAPFFRWPNIERATGPVDVVHATAVAFPAARVPVVVTIHDLAFLQDRQLATRHGHRFFRRGLELARRHARLVMCPSEATADECRAAGVEGERIRIAPWGVACSTVTDEAVRRVLEHYGLDGRYVLFVGTIEPRKNLPRLLDAFARVPDQVQLVLVGPAGWNESIDAQLETLGDRVRVLGFVERGHLDAIIAGASVFCYPSLREGFGLPVLEAMAQGTPVVTSKGTSTEEVAGDAGLLVDPLDVDAIAGAIHQLLSDPEAARRLGAKGRERAKTFTWPRSADVVASVYKEATS